MTVRSAILPTANTAEKNDGNGFAPVPPNNIPHSKCNYNKKQKGWWPEWVCQKIGIEYKSMTTMRNKSYMWGYGRESK